MRRQIPLSHRSRVGRVEPSVTRHSGTHDVSPDLAYKRIAIVNVIFIGKIGSPDRQWVLVDAGVNGTARLIARAAVQRFGAESRPACILLTHGHFDHVGALAKLAEHWDAPIVAHEGEFKYLNGEAEYPKPDPSVGGGLMSTLASLYPRGPVNVGSRLMPLPMSGEVPHLPVWRWIPTPGHSPGHVSFWRESDRALISGDAVISTNQESAYSVAVQRPELHGPPMYYTPDWASAHESARRLAELQPEVLLTGHGPALRGSEMREGLSKLATEFDEIAVPEQGRYVSEPGAS